MTSFSSPPSPFQCWLMALFRDASLKTYWPKHCAEHSKVSKCGHVTGCVSSCLALLIRDPSTNCHRKENIANWLAVRESKIALQGWPYSTGLDCRFYCRCTYRKLYLELMNMAPLLPFLFHRLPSRSFSSSSGASPSSAQSEVDCCCEAEREGCSEVKVYCP